MFLFPCVERDVEAEDQKTNEPKTVVSSGPLIMTAPEQLTAWPQELCWEQQVKKICNMKTVISSMKWKLDYNVGEKNSSVL